MVLNLLISIVEDIRFVNKIKGENGMKQDYYLGIDIGTGSVGWAVTDENYKIIRKHGKSMWGVRLFESANTAEERRVFRTSRRRLDRRNRRIQILQELFAENINDVDSGFFQRMKESKYFPEDKRDIQGKCPELPYALFVDKDFTDKEYHKKFPTIYHLRKELMYTTETPDIRLVYLALHHILKHRGHFLLAGNIETIKEFKSTFETLLQYVREEELSFNTNIDDELIKQIETIIRNKTYSKSQKKSALIKCIGAKESCEKAIYGLLAGCTVKLSDIFDDEQLEECEKNKISFSDNGYDEYISGVEADLGERYVIIEAAKAVYDWSILVDILGNYESISDAKVAIYEKHAKDLQYLKRIAKEYLNKSEYRDLFVYSSDKLKNYPAYIGMSKINGKKIDIQGKKANKDEFYDYLKKKVLNKIKSEEDESYLKNELEKGTFLPKAVNSDNSVLPQQIHAYELKKILENLEERIPLIKENKEKLIQLFEFRIPYYVGPLNVSKDDESKFTWAVRKTNDKIYPWNFEEVIDIEASAEKFIRRMTNKCTYLKGKDVLPKDSLLYSKFMVLNELNNVRLDGEPLSVKLKQRIYEDVFKKSRKVTQKKLKDYLRREGISGKNVEITGIDGDFKASLASYHDFKEKLTNITLNDKEKEKIILNIVLFGDDKKLLEKRIRIMFPQLTDNQIKAVRTLSYKGWGRLSKEFLQEVTAPAPETGEVWNIITALWETNDNLMQLLSNRYLFKQTLDEWNDDGEKTKLTYQTIDDLYVSPAVKRQIWQTITIVKEIQKIMGRAPKRVFIEMAREKQESKRTETRKKQLLDLYKKCKEEERDWAAELFGRQDHEFRSDRLFLYYTQKGKCMYSGEPIALEDLWDNNKYDIDHIYPQSKVMDDSIDNRVLVKREENMNKSDNYPIKETIRAKQGLFWKSLLMCGFISKEKYKRLTRCDEFDENELGGFIQRQLVETRQSTKAVAEILKKALPNTTDIVYTKAKVVSNFRRDFNLIKVRDLNDFHHAKDAYLNVVVGNVYHVKFTKDAVWYVKTHPGRSYNLKKMFTEQNVCRNGEEAWKCGKTGTIATVKHYMDRNDILVVRKSYEVKGGLFDQQLMKKGKGQVPIKESDERLSAEDGINKYGGYNKATGAYYMLVESQDKKGEKQRTIEYIPLYLKDEIEKDDGYALKYLSEERGLCNPKICIKKIKTDTLFDMDGFKMWLSGRTDVRLIFKCANQLLMSNDETKTLKKVLKYVQRYEVNKNTKLTVWEELSSESLIALYDRFLDKLKDTIYKVRYAKQIETLTEKRGNFVTLSDEEKCIVLSEILHLFQCNSSTANLKLIDGPAGAGVIVINKNITKCNRIFIIHQSVTGIFEQKVDLKTV